MNSWLHLIVLVAIHCLRRPGFRSLRFRRPGFRSLFTRAVHQSGHNLPGFLIAVAREVQIDLGGLQVWPGKLVRNSDGEVAIEIIKGQGASRAEEQHKIQPQTVLTQVLMPEITLQYSQTGKLPPLDLGNQKWS